jgi:hypothetical protein
VRRELLALLSGGNSHMSFDQVVGDLPVEEVNRRAAGVPYTPWQLMEHMRIAQWDILEFVRNPDHTSPPWPEGYWPPRNEEVDAIRWVETVNAFRADLRAMQELVADPEADLMAPLPHAPKYTLLREVLVLADHNAYHLGEFALMREVMDSWPAQPEA